jgi:hypothetical protein
MKSIFYFFLALSLLFTSCISSEEDKGLYKKIALEVEKSDTLYCKPTKINGNKIGRVMMMQFVGANLVVGDLPKDYLFKVYDQDLNYLFDLCKIGEGPNEYRFPTFLQAFYKEGKLKVKAFNPSKARCDELDWTQTISTKSAVLSLKSPIVFNTQVQKFVYLPESNELLSVGLFPKRYRVSDSIGNTKQEFGEYPFQKDFKKISFENLAMAFQGDFTKNNNNIAFSVTNSPNIDFITSTPKGLVLKKQFHVRKPDFQPSSNPNEFSAAISTDNKMGFLDVQSDKNYVYALYSGKDLQKGVSKAFESNIIYVFNWSGDLLRRFVLDLQITKFCINNNKLYGFVDSVNPQIVYCDLPSF